MELERRSSGLTRLREFLVFRCNEVQPGHRIDPAQMIVDLLHACDVLGANDGGLPRTFIGDDAAKKNDKDVD